MSGVFEKLKEDVVPILLSGLIGGLGEKYILKGSSKEFESIFGMKLSKPVVAGITVGGSSAIASVTGDILANKFPKLGYLSKPIVAGASTMAIDYFNPKLGLKPIKGFMLGAGSDLSARYINAAFLKKKTNQNP